MKTVLKITGVIFALTICGVAQNPVRPTPGQLELRLQPESVVMKIPQAFTILMVNGTDHDIHVPKPSLECGDVPHGTVWLRLDVRPYDYAANEVRGCVNDFVYSPMSEVIKGWKVMHPGESLILATLNDRVLAEKAGSYDYWAHYDPPGMPESDREWLRTAGIDYPKEELDSTHVKFVKRQLKHLPSHSTVR